MVSTTRSSLNRIRPNIPLFQLTEHGKWDLETRIWFFEFLEQSNSCHLHNMLVMLLINASSRTLSQDMLSIWYSMRMVVPILYHLLSNALFHPIFICFSIYKSPTSSFIVFIYPTLNLVYLCSVFLEMWSNFVIIVTIQFLEVLRATITVVISLWAMLI